MRYHDAERPKDGSGWGRVVAPSGQTLGPLQALIIEPLPDGTWELRIHLQRAPATFREYSCKLHFLALTTMLSQWAEDPERVLAEYFKYDFKMDSSHSQAHPSPPSRPQGTTLEDLGL